VSKLILSRTEETPEEPNACVLVAYFDGDPTPAELEDAAKTAASGSDASGGTFERADDEISTRAGLQRWLLWPSS